MKQLRRKLLEQDECAPDAGKYFDKDLKRIVGRSTEEFKKFGRKVSDDDADYIEWHYGEYALLYFCDSTPVLELRMEYHFRTMMEQHFGDRLVSNHGWERAKDNNEDGYLFTKGGKTVCFQPAMRDLFTHVNVKLDQVIRTYEREQDA